MRLRILLTISIIASLINATFISPAKADGLGGYAIIHPDSHVCGVIVATSSDPYGNGGVMPIEYMGCPIGSKIAFQTKPSPTGNVAGWHGADVIYSGGVFRLGNGTTIQNGIATDPNGRVWDTGSGLTITPAPTPSATSSSTSSPSTVETQTTTSAPTPTPTPTTVPPSIVAGSISPSTVQVGKQFTVTFEINDRSSVANINENSASCVSAGTRVKAKLSAGNFTGGNWYCEMTFPGSVNPGNYQVIAEVSGIGNKDLGSVTVVSSSAVTAEWNPPADSYEILNDYDGTYDRICLTLGWTNCGIWTIYNANGLQLNRVVGPYPLSSLVALGCQNSKVNLCGGDPKGFAVLNGVYAKKGSPLPSTSPTPSPTPTPSQTPTATYGPLAFVESTFSVSANEMNAGSSSSFSITIVNTNNVNTTSCGLTTPDGGKIVAISTLTRISGDASSGSWRCSFSVEPTVSETYGRVFINLIENRSSRNIQFIKANAILIKNLGGGDSEKPSIINLTNASLSLTAGEAISITFKVTDNTGVTTDGTYCSISSDGGNNTIVISSGAASQSTLLTGSLRDGTWSCNFIVPNNLPAGNYGIYGEAIDTTRNWSGRQSIGSVVVAAAKSSTSPTSNNSGSSGTPITRNVLPPCTGGNARTQGLPQCSMPENLPGSTWNEVSNSTGVVLNGAVCSASVCGMNGEWRNLKNANGQSTPNGYPVNSTYIQSPTNGASWGKYYTNGVYETAGGDIYQPGSLTPEPRIGSVSQPTMRPDSATVISNQETKTTTISGSSNNNVELKPNVTVVPQVISQTKVGIGTQFGGYAVIHPDGHVCGVTVSNGAFIFNANGTMPIAYMGCPVGSPLIFQTKPSPTGNVAGWHGENVVYANGIFYISYAGKVTTTIRDGIATDSNGRVWDTGSGVTLVSAPSSVSPKNNDSATVINQESSTVLNSGTTVSQSESQTQTLGSGNSISSNQLNIPSGETSTVMATSPANSAKLKIENGDSPNTKEVTGTTSEIKQVVKVLTTVSQEAKAITTLVSNLDSMKQPSVKSTSIILPKSVRVTESATSQTPEVCTVIDMTVKSLKKGTCEVLYTVSDSVGNVYNTTKTFEFKK